MISSENGRIFDLAGLNIKHKGLGALTCEIIVDVLKMTRDLAAVSDCPIIVVIWIIG